MPILGTGIFKFNSHSIKDKEKNNDNAAHHYIKRLLKKNMP